MKLQCLTTAKSRAGSKTTEQYNTPKLIFIQSSAVDAILPQAVSLANVLSFAFDTPTGIPQNNLFIGDQTSDGAPTNGLATIGSLVLEWTHLSDLTGNATYGQLTQKAESYLLNPSPAYNEPFPGLVGTSVNISNAQFLDASGGWVGGDDSFYEYLIKMYIYDPSRFGEYRDRCVRPQPYITGLLRQND